jgi:hypothetical protein
MLSISKSRIEIYITVSEMVMWMKSCFFGNRSYIVIENSSKLMYLVNLKYIIKTFLKKGVLVILLI